jgi:hypothetical protein
VKSSKAQRRGGEGVNHVTARTAANHANQRDPLQQASKGEIECLKMFHARLSQAQTDPLFEKASFPIESATPPFGRLA